MKRSEAVEKFARYINNKIQHRDNWNLALRQADDLLKIAEELMIPNPMVKLDKSNPENMEYVTVFEWEGEDG